MRISEKELITTLIESVNTLNTHISDLNERVTDLEASINMGRGAFKFFLILLSVLGTGIGVMKIMGR